jgi:hypothetical protein
MFEAEHKSLSSWGNEFSLTRLTKFSTVLGPDILITAILQLPHPTNYMFEYILNTK